jgi:hypothetical protein
MKLISTHSRPGHARRTLLRGLGLGGLAAMIRGAPNAVAAQQLQPGPIDPLQPLRALFEFHVRQGPSAGLDLNGVVTLQADASGALSGAWTLADQTVVNIVGQATGRAINLLLRLSDDRVVFGVGTADRAWGDALTIMGGVASGPDSGDVSDWLLRTTGSQSGGGG